MADSDALSPRLTGSPRSSGVHQLPVRLEYFDVHYYVSLVEFVARGLLLPPSCYAFLEPASRGTDSPLVESLSSDSLTRPGQAIPATAAAAKETPPLFERLVAIFRDSSSFESMELYFHKHAMVIGRRRLYFPAFLSFVHTVRKYLARGGKITERRLRQHLDTLMSAILALSPPYFSDQTLSCLWRWWMPQALDLCSFFTMDQISLPPFRFALTKAVSVFVENSAFLVFILAGGYSPSHNRLFTDAAATSSDSASTTTAAATSSPSSSPSLSSSSERKVPSSSRRRLFSSPMPLPSADSLEDISSAAPLSSLPHVRQASEQHSQLVAELSERYARTPAVPSGPQPRLLTGRQRKLRKLLLRPPFTLVQTVAHVQCVASSSNDSVLQAIVWYFDEAHMLLPLFEAVIAQEVHASSSDHTTLFRGESPCTRMMSVLFSSPLALAWLRQLIGPFLDTLIVNNVGLEVDPKKLMSRMTSAGSGGGGGGGGGGGEASSSGESLPSVNQVQQASDNGVQLVRVAQELLDHLKYTAAPTCPALFRLLFAVMRRCIRLKFPQMELLSIGAFLFLRFISPAIVTPQKYSLVKGRVSPAVSRTCMLVVKLLQALVNGVLLDGSKEEYMNFQQANDFIAGNQEDVRTFLEDLSVQPYDTANFNPFVRFLDPRPGVNELATIEDFIADAGAKSLVARLHDQPDVLARVLAYTTAGDPFIFRTIDRQPPMHSLISKLPDAVRSAIFNKVLWVSSSPLASLGSELLAPRPNFNHQLLWENFYHRLETVLSSLVELLRFWPTQAVVINPAERKRYLCSQLCFVDHLLKTTFRGMIPTESQQEMSVWLSLFNIMRAVVFFAVRNIDLDPLSVHQSLVLATSQLRWTSAAIFTHYFPQR